MRRDILFKYIKSTIVETTNILLLVFYIFHRFNLVFNIIGTPTLILFHNGMPIVVFQGANFTLYELTLFIVNHTGMYIYILYICLLTIMLKGTRDEKNVLQH